MWLFPIIVTVVTALGCSSLTMNKKQDPKKDTKQEEKDPHPILNSPIVKKVWVPEKIEDNKYIEGHFMYVIEKNVQWRK